MSWAREGDLPDTGWRQRDLTVAVQEDGTWAIVAKHDPDTVVDSGFHSRSAAADMLAEGYDDCD